MRRLLPVALLLGSAALARPPAAPHYARHDTLEVILRERQQDLQRREEFEAKPFVWRALIRFSQGHQTYERLRLTGDKVIEEIEKWEALAQPTASLSEEAKGVLADLAPALGKRFPRGGDIDRLERYKASKLLVDWLTHDLYHFRATGIAGLEAMYQTRRMYQPDKQAADRKRLQRDWLNYIKKERNR